MPTQAAKLATAKSVAACCGVTRLADITYLDRLGVRAFQAIRPLSRALSVHQGKGFTAAAAKLGALMEAVESHCAETFAGETRRACFQALPTDQRAPELADFASTRASAPGTDEPLAWTPAQHVQGRGRLWVPFDVVSLDFSRRGDPRLERSSTGLGCRFDLPGALMVALLEVIERDALAGFLAGSTVRRALARVEGGSIPLPWFSTLRARAEAADLVLAVYAAPAAIPMPVVVAEILEPGAPEALRSRVYGVGCHFDPDVALQRAVLEAAQSRLTAISGARDDLPTTPLRDQHAHVVFGLGLPPPPGRSLSWADVAAGPCGPADVSAIAARLVQAGYGPCAYVDLSPPGGAVFVVKAVVPGLACNDRGRRAGYALVA